MSHLGNIWIFHAFESTVFFGSVLGRKKICLWQRNKGIKSARNGSFSKSKHLCDVFWGGVWWKIQRCVCSKVHVNAFISDTLKAGLWLYPFTTLYESYKPINLPRTPHLGKQRLGWVGMVIKISWPRTLLNRREPLAPLSSSRSVPQPLKLSFIPAFIAAFGLFSLTYHCTRLNISFPHGLELVKKQGKNKIPKHNTNKLCGWTWEIGWVLVR